MIHCDQCQALMINGTFCHETGCANARKTWNGEEWVRMVKCLNCDYAFEEGSGHDCTQYEEEEEEEE
jgi:hypothetical protein